MMELQVTVVPENVKAARSDCEVVTMRPPSGVSDDDCGTAEMLISPVESVFPGVPARRQFAYFRPTPEQVEVLAAGGVIEFCQYGRGVHPFSARVWPATDADCEG